MRPRTLLALFALVAGLGSFIWFFERGLPSTQERAEQDKKLLRLDEDSVRALTLISGERRVRLERTVAVGSGGATVAAGGEPEPGALEPRGGFAGEWLLTRPHRARADTGEVENFLGSVRSLEKRRTLEDGSRAEFGLNPAPATLVLETESGEVSLRFGARVPASSNVIAELDEGPPFFVVSDAVLEGIGREANAWRSRVAIPVEASEIDKIEILDSEGDVIIERSGSSFRLVAPVSDEADEARVDELITALVDLEVQEFVDGMDTWIEAPTASARLTIAGSPSPMRVDIEKTPEDLAWVRVNEEIFRARTGLVALLEGAPGHWRSTRWSAASAFEVDSFEIRREGTEDLHFERRDGEWFCGEDAADYSVVNAFLRAVTQVAGAPVESVSPPDAAPDLEIDLEFEGAEESLRLWSGKDGYLAERSGREAVLGLEEDSAARLFSELDKLQAEVPTVGEPVAVETGNPTGAG